MRNALPTKKVLLVAALLLLLAGGGWLYATLSEVGLTGLMHQILPKPSHAGVQLKEQPVYRIKKSQELLGMSVARIISSRQPEEFLVVDGVSRKMVDSVYGKEVDLAWANLMANQFLKLREHGEESSPVSVDVQTVKTLKTGSIERDGRQLPYWQVEVRFKLSNEDQPRAYSAGVIRHGGRGDNDTLIVGYAQKEAFEQALLADVLNHLDFQAN